MSVTTSKTIQDCAGMTAAERRERRRQKVLQNAEGRITRILSGPDGTERRQAPAIDGIYAENEEEGEKTTTQEFTPRKGGLLANISQDQIDYVQPVYCEFVDRNRFGIMLFLGFALRLAVQLGWIEYVTLVFCTLFLGYQLLLGFLGQLPQLKYPKHGYLVNFLLVCSLNERMVVWLGLILDVLWEFATDFCIFSFAFLSTHLLIQLTSLIIS